MARRATAYAPPARWQGFGLRLVGPAAPTPGRGHCVRRSCSMKLVRFHGDASRFRPERVDEYQTGTSPWSKYIWCFVTVWPETRTHAMERTSFIEQLRRHRSALGTGRRRSRSHGRAESLCHEQAVALSSCRALPSNNLLPRPTKQERTKAATPPARGANRPGDIRPRLGRGYGQSPVFVVTGCDVAHTVAVAVPYQWQMAAGHAIHSGRAVGHCRDCTHRVAGGSHSPSASQS